MLLWILLIVLFFMAIASVPAYPYSRRWSYYPSSGAGLLIVLLIVLWYMSWLPMWGHYGWWR